MSTTAHRTRQSTRLHHTLRAAVQAERRAMHTIAHGLAEMKQTQYYKELGYAGLLEYAEAEFGHACRKTQQLARAGCKLRDLPRLDQAFALGAIGWTKVRTVVTVATTDNEPNIVAPGGARAGAGRRGRRRRHPPRRERLPRELPRHRAPLPRELVECDCEVVHGDADHDHAGHVAREIPPAVR